MDGQKRLKNAKVLCVGAGGLGSPALMYLAAAGVGTLGIVGFDEVDESINISGWARYANTQSCPACGAAGALQLGGGLFCPTCKEVTTNPGYTPPA